jgi:hypothetical protein
MENDSPAAAATTKPDLKIVPPLADQPAATAVAAPKATGVVVRKAFSYVLQDLDQAIDPINVGDLTRLKSGAGNIKDAEGTNYGTFVSLELLSFHTSWTISPGKDSDEAKQMVRYSLDGKNIDNGGGDVEAYVENLKTVEGYPDANVKRYLILAGIINDCDKAKEKIGSIVQLSLAPQSAKTFNNYHMQRSVLVSRGTMPADGSQMLRITAEGASMNGKDFTKLIVSGEVA